MHIVYGVDVVNRSQQNLGGLLYVGSNCSYFSDNNNNNINDNNNNNSVAG